MNLNWIKKIFLKAPSEEEERHVMYRPHEYPSIFGASIWAVGGGKGGVGKSFVASNIGVAIARQGRKVLMIDADLGAANLHTFLGIDGGSAALSSFLKEEISDINTLVTKTHMPNLDLISGSRDSLDVADVSAAKIARLKEALRKLDYDNIVVDVGPGTSSNMLDLFLMANEGIILSTPEPTTIENNYRFLKCLFLRKIKTVADSQEDGRLKDILQKIFSDRWTQRIRTVQDILGQIEAMDAEQGRLLRGYFSSMSISMIMNQTKRAEDSEVGSGIKRACTEYFGIEIGYLGSIAYDDSVGESIRMRRPLLSSDPASPAARSIDGCIRQLFNKNNAPGPGQFSMQ